jgi:hypothetical protein
MNKKLYFLIFLSLGFGQGCFCDDRDVAPAAEEKKIIEMDISEPAPKKTIDMDVATVEEWQESEGSEAEPEAQKRFPKNLMTYWNSEQGLLIKQWQGEFGDLEGKIEDHRIKLSDLLDPTNEKYKDLSYQEKAQLYMKNRNKIHAILKYQAFKNLERYLTDNGVAIEQLDPKTVEKALDDYKKDSLKKRTKTKFLKKRKTTFRMWEEKYEKKLGKAGKKVDTSRGKRRRDNIKRFNNAINNAEKIFAREYNKTQRAFNFAIERFIKKAEKLMKGEKISRTFWQKAKNAVGGAKKAWDDLDPETKKKFKETMKKMGEGIKKAAKWAAKPETQEKARELFKKIAEEAKKWKESFEDIKEKEEKEPETPPTEEKPEIPEAPPLPETEKIEEEPGVPEAPPLPEPEEEKEVIKEEVTEEPREVEISVTEKEEPEVEEAEMEVEEEEGVPVPPPAPEIETKKPTKKPDEEETIFEQIRKFKKEKLKKVTPEEEAKRAEEEKKEESDGRMELTKRVLERKKQMEGGEEKQKETTGEEWSELPE